jgi:titin
VRIEGATASPNFIRGNYIGSAQRYGVWIDNSPGNEIGGLAAGSRNVIAANEVDGVLIQGTGASGNKVQGNYIGTDFDGITNLGNGQNGVTIMNTPNTEIGGTSPGCTVPITGVVCPGNVIAHNHKDGVQIQGATATGTVIQGNYIGIAANGASAGALPSGNIRHGILIDNAGGNTVGGSAPGARNVISWNIENGVQIQGASAPGNTVNGNYIGTDAGGTLNNRGNGKVGVFVNGAPGTIIGAPGARNVISGNTWHGIQIQDVAST